MVFFFVEVSRPIFRLGLEIFNIVGGDLLRRSVGREKNGLDLGGRVRFGRFGTRFFFAHDEGLREASAR